MSAAVQSRAAPQPKLRYPFRVVTKAATYTAGVVNSSIDGCVKTQSKAIKAINSNVYVNYLNKGITGFGQGVQGKVAPFTAKAQPYVQPVVPYLEKAKPWVPSAIMATLLVIAPPVLTFLAFVAFITAPIWLTIAFFTAFIWIPIAICAFLASAFVVFVATVRYFSLPTGQAKLQKMWKTVTRTRLGKQIFYVM